MIGFKSSGKSSLAKALASILHLEMIDTDELIGDNPRKVYLEKGKAYFRAVEQKMISGLCDCRDKVIATGGGCVLNLENVKILQQIGWIVYLCVDKEELKSRIFSQNSLPAFFTGGSNLEGNENLKQFEELYITRHLIYQKVANQIIQFGSLSIEGQLDCFLQSLNPYLNWRMGREKSK